MHQAPSQAAGSAGQDHADSGPLESTSLQAIAYVSSARAALSEPELETLLCSARERNVRQGVSGVLLYHDGSFFQYLEGPPAGVDLVWGHIRRSSQHTGILPLMRVPVSQRAFPDWLMGFTRAPKSFLLQLANSSWHEKMSEMEVPGRDSEGMSLLRHFWATSCLYEGN